MTALAGLPVYLDLASVIYLGDGIGKHLHVKIQGWTDEQIITSLILLNLAGGDCVDDLRILEADEGFCRILRRIELEGLSRRQRRETERRWRPTPLPRHPGSTLTTPPPRYGEPSFSDHHLR